ncbi:hypothetical protein HNY73_002324 [Argiope bruennichi]|uniref:Uncharacterized protein n=1 Tax=Argiope bruennichi TaxID=94029 RepID=A0A8T0FZM0_ARGBR|nr:hypothetical protein HNY73_002324 [Argiope bruennichi]
MNTSIHFLLLLTEKHCHSWKTKVLQAELSCKFCSVYTGMVFTPGSKSIGTLPKVTELSYRDGPCYDNEFQCNGLCILKQYVCDGHNHCGDRSDQNSCVPKKETASNTYRDSYLIYPNSNIIWISIIGAAGVVVFIIVIVFIVVVVRMRKAKARPAENSNNQNSGGNATLHSVSSTVPQQSPPAPTTGAVPSAPPAPEHESFSFYNRVRRSLRGMRIPKLKNYQKIWSLQKFTKSRPCIPILSRPNKRSQEVELKIQNQKRGMIMNSLVCFCSK